LVLLGLGYQLLGVSDSSGGAVVLADGGVTSFVALTDLAELLLGEFL
jgi:hypothetical protein